MPAGTAGMAFQGDNMFLTIIQAAESSGQAAWPRFFDTRLTDLAAVGSAGISRQLGSFLVAELCGYRRLRPNREKPAPGHNTACISALPIWRPNRPSLPAPTSAMQRRFWRPTFPLPDAIIWQALLTLQSPRPGAFKTGVQAAFPKPGGGRPGRTCAAPLAYAPRPRRCGPSPAWTAPLGMCRPRPYAPAPPECRA